MVERNLAKVEVVGSNPISRSIRLAPLWPSAKMEHLMTNKPDNLTLSEKICDEKVFYHYIEFDHFKTSLKDQKLRFKDIVDFEDREFLKKKNLNGTIVNGVHKFSINEI